MDTKAVVAPVKKSTPTPIPQLSPTVGLTNVRPFADEQIALKEEESSSEQKLGGATPPPPEIQRNSNVNSGYNFSQIAITEYIPATPQTKLVVGAPGDRYEKEADAMADKVVSMVVPVQRQEESPEQDLEEHTPSAREVIQARFEEEGTVHLKPTTDTIQAPPEEEGTIHLKPTTDTIQAPPEEEGTVRLKPLALMIQRQTEPEGTVHLKRLSQRIQCKEIEGVVHLKPINNHISPAFEQTLKQSTLISRKSGGGFMASENIETRLKSGKGGGQPLPDETREFMESRFGNDFSGVKVHTGSDAVQLSKELNAQAFTHGEDVYFNSGKYSPHTDEGKKLLAHELTHTIQQTGPKIKPKFLSPKIQKKSKIQRKTQSSWIKNRVKPINPPSLKTTPGQSLQREDETTTDSQSSEQKTEATSVTSDTQETADATAEERKKKIEADKQTAQEELQKDTSGDEKTAAMKQYLAEESIKTAKTQAEDIKSDADEVKNKIKSGEKVEQFEAESQENLEAKTQQEHQELDATIKEKAETKNQEAEENQKTDSSDTSETLDSENKDSETESESQSNSGNQATIVEEEITTNPPANSEENEEDLDTSPITIPEVSGEETPDSPDKDPAFQGVLKQAKQQARKQKQHKPPQAVAQEAQKAAEDPNQQLRKAQTTKVGSLSAKETKPFDREAFEEQLLIKLDLVKPKNQDEADNFASSGKTDQIKESLNSEVKNTKTEAGGGLPEESATPPQPETEEPKEVESLPSAQEEVGTIPEEIEAEKAVPKEKTSQEIEEPLTKTSQNLDSTFGEIQAKFREDSPENQTSQRAEEATPHPEPQALQLEPEQPSTHQHSIAEEIHPISTLSIQPKAEIKPQSVEQPDSEVPLNVERLETWKDEGGGQALEALKATKTHATKTGPEQFRKDEQNTQTAAKTDATTTAQQTNTEMFAQRSESIQQTADTQIESKSQDEIKRDEINANIQQIFDQTQEKVTTVLAKMDSDVEAEFAEGTKRAKERFENHVKTQMAQYKARRYTLTFPIKLPKPYWFGIKMVKVGEIKVFDLITWIKDKFMGLPSEVNAFYEEGKSLYIEELKKSISKIAGIVETGLNAAQAEVNQGREKVSAYVQSLPQDLQEIGSKAASEAETKFNQLEQSIQEKQASLVDSLTEKYQANLKELDKRIEQLKAENEGLLGKALKFIGDLAKGIIKALLWPIKKILSALIGNLAEKVIDAIIDDPIGFMKNLFKGIGDGIKNFAKNIDKHIIKGIVRWLMGNMGELKIPEKFDLKGFLDIILQVLGLTKEYIFALVERNLGTVISKLIQFILNVVLKQGVDSLKYLWDLVKLVVEVGPDVIMTLISEGAEALESFPDSVQKTVQGVSGGISGLLQFAGEMVSSLGEEAFDLISGLGPGVKFIFTFFSTLMKDGIGGTWKFLKSSLGEIKGIFMKGVMEMAIVEIVQAGITWLIGMMNPASGLAKIAKAIFDVISFFIERREQIKTFVQAILESLKAVCEGAPAIMAQMIEMALANMIPILLGFLASLIGVGGIPGKIKKIITQLKAPVDKTIGRLFEKAKSFFGGGKAKKGKTARNGKDQQPQDDPKKRIKYASRQTKKLADHLRDPDSVEQNLSQIKTKYKLHDLKLKKKGKKKYQITGKTQVITAQRQVEPGASHSGQIRVQLKGESPWKDKKNKVLIKQKVKGNKKTASLTLTAKVTAKAKILPKVATKLKFMIKRKPSARWIRTKLPALKSKYELQSLTMDVINLLETKYIITGIVPDDEQSTTAQRQAMSGLEEPLDIQNSVETGIQRSIGQGEPLPTSVREPMENAFGFDFAQVRIHHDTEGDRLSRSLDARAFTTGQDVFFRQGAYSPESPSGKRLLAHELTHVVQQSGEGSVEPGSDPSPLLSRTVQRVSEQVPSFVQRKAESSSEAQDDLEDAQRNAQIAAAVGGGIAIASNLMESRTEEDSYIRQSIKGNKLTMRVTIIKSQQKQQKKRSASIGTGLALPDDMVNDIVALIQQIVNQSPNPDIVQKKLDKVCVDFDLDLLKVIGSATIGDSMTYEIQMKGRPQHPTDENTSAIAKNLESLTPKQQTVSLLGSLFSNNSKSKTEETVKDSKSEKTSETSTKDTKKIVETETKDKQETEELAEDKQADQPQSRKASLGQKIPLDVSTKVKRLDPTTVEISVRADPKKK